MYITHRITKTLVLCLLMAFSTTVNAQSFCAPCLANFRTYNNTAITTKTGAKSITPINVGGNIDSVSRYIGDVASLVMSGCTCDLQTVLNNGNTADQIGGNVADIYLSNSSGVIQMAISPNQLIEGNSGGLNIALTGSTLTGGSGGTVSYQLNGGISGSLALRDGTSSFNSTLFPAPFGGSLTANRSYYFPDESAGNNTIVTHATKDSVFVTNSFGKASLASKGLRTYNASGVLQTYLGTQTVGVSPVLMLRNISGAQLFLSTVGSVNGDHIYFLPDEYTSPSVQHNTIVTHYTNDFITVQNGGGNPSSVLDGGSLIADDGAGHVSTFNTTHMSVVDGAGSSSNIVPGSTTHDITVGTQINEGRLSGFGLTLVTNDPSTSTIGNYNLNGGIAPVGATNTYNIGLPNLSGQIDLTNDAVNPATTLGVGAGAAGARTLRTGSGNKAGEVDITTGIGAVAGTLINVTFVTPYPTGVIPFVTIGAANDPAAAIFQSLSVPYASLSNTGFSIRVNAALPSANTYAITYQVQW